MKQLTRYLPLILLAVTWELAARFELVSTTALPPLSAVIASWIDMIKDGELITNGLSSLFRAGAGLALAVFVGAILGITMAWWKPVNVLLAPIVEVFYPLPKSALIPVTVIWLGFGDGSKILLIFLGCMLPVTIGAFNGAQHGRQPAAHAVGRGGAERHAGTAQRHPHRAGAVVHSAGVVRIDRGAEGLRFSHRLSRRQRQLRCDVCGGADRGVPRFRRRPDLSCDHQADTGMARVATISGVEMGALQIARNFLWALARVASIVALLAAWEILARSGVYTHYQLPALSDVIVRIGNEAWSGDLWINTALTLYRALTAFAICAVFGVIIGMAMSRSVIANWFFDPIVSVGFPMPKIAFLPVVILWLGVYDVSKITIIVIDAIFPVIAATVIAIQGVERELIWSARNMGANNRELLTQIVLPAALPQIMTGLQVALPLSLIVAVVAEMLMGGYGLGGAMMTASRFANSTGVFAGIVEIAVVGYCLVKAMTLIRRRLLIWHQEANEPTTV